MGILIVAVLFANVIIMLCVHIFCIVSRATGMGIMKVDAMNVIITLFGPY